MKAGAVPRTSNAAAASSPSSSSPGSGCTPRPRPRPPADRGARRAHPRPLERRRRTPIIADSQRRQPSTFAPSLGRHLVRVGAAFAWPTLAPLDASCRRMNHSRRGIVRRRTGSLASPNRGPSTSPRRMSATTARPRFEAASGNPKRKGAPASSGRGRRHRTRTGAVGLRHHRRLHRATGEAEGCRDPGVGGFDQRSSPGWRSRWRDGWRSSRPPSSDRPASSVRRRRR